MANNTELADAIRLLAEKLNLDKVERPETAGEMFERLSKVKPPYFKGQADPTFLENWIREFEKLFECNTPLGSTSPLVDIVLSGP